MYFSRITIPRLQGARGSMSALLRAVDKPYDTHRMIWSLLGDDHGDKVRDFVFRVDEVQGDKKIYVVSANPPRDHHKLFQIESKEFDPQPEAGQLARFSLRANPAVNRKTDVLANSGKRRKSSRIDVVTDFVVNDRYEDPENKWSEAVLKSGTEWIEKKARDHGFSIQEVLPSGYRKVTAKPAGRQKGDAKIGVLEFDGVLRVTDSDAFRHALLNGIGRGKAFGMGLLLARPL